MTGRCKLKIDNCYSFLETNDKELKKKLWQGLRFRERNYFHSPAYKMKKWDGYVDFFSLATGRFLTGLLPEVKYAIKSLGSEYDVIDKRNPVTFTIGEVTEDWLNIDKPKNIEPVTLRDYQIDYINQSIRNRRGIIHAPTSAGKTNILIGILKAIPKECPIVVLTNSTSLLEQNYDEISKWNIFPKVGRFYGRIKDVQDITCITVQSFHLLLDWLKTVRAVVVDEVHDLMSAKALAFYRSLPKASIRIGMSATPFRYGEKDKVHKFKVKGNIGPVFEAKSTDTGKITVKELQERNILSAAECTFYYIDDPKMPHAIYGDAVTYGIAENSYLNEKVVVLLSKIKGRTLLLVERIAHGDRLQEMYPKALWVRGQDTIDTRKQVLEQLRVSNEDIVAIATQKIFNTGVNVFLHNLVNCAAGKAEHAIIQRFGRGLRTAKDKDTLQYYDFYFRINDYLERHSQMRVDILKKEGHNVIIKDFDL